VPKPFYPYAPVIQRLTAAEFTRPSDTTQYTAGDVVGPVTTPATMSFANAAFSTGGGGIIRAIRIHKSTATVTLSTFRLWFYNADVTPIADNSAWTTLYADRGKLIGYVDPVIMVSGGSGAATYLANADIRYNTVAGKTIYAVLSAVGAYTPASAETFSVSLTVEKL
jgi:hypothetical protein